METRHEDSDGSDIFWPGYVDATTNLILNLLFLLTILIVAVFMFALELGRTNPNTAKSDKPPVAAAKPYEEQIVPESASDATDKENIELKLEIERLKKLLAQRNPPKEQTGGPAVESVKEVAATASLPKLRQGLDQALANQLEVIVHFKNEAVALTQAEQDRLLENLKPIVDSGKTTINVEIPPGFSEAKRMAFYRAMAVRNLLIEMKMPKEDIDVSVVEGKSDADASIVRVRGR